LASWRLSDLGAADLFREDFGATGGLQSRVLSRERLAVC
jgi:hypothetical protein